MVQGGGMVGGLCHWVCITMGPWASSLQHMGPSRIMAIIKSTSECSYEGFCKVIYIERQIYNYCSMNITSVPPFPQLFQNFQESGLKKTKASVSKALKGE